jgi:hypothetical protein
MDIGTASHHGHHPAAPLLGLDDRLHGLVHSGPGFWGKACVHGIDHPAVNIHGDTPFLQVPKVTKDIQFNETKFLNFSHFQL